MYSETTMVTTTGPRVTTSTVTNGVNQRLQGLDSEPRWKLTFIAPRAGQMATLQSSACLGGENSRGTTRRCCFEKPLGPFWCHFLTFKGCFVPVWFITIFRISLLIKLISLSVYMFYEYIDISIIYEYIRRRFNLQALGKWCLFIGRIELTISWNLAIKTWVTCLWPLLHDTTTSKI